MGIHLAAEGFEVKGLARALRHSVSIILSRRLEPAKVIDIEMLLFPGGRERHAGDEVVLRIEDDELRITTLKRRLERAQRLVRKHVKPGTSLVDELIAERREAARNE